MIFAIVSSCSTNNDQSNNSSTISIVPVAPSNLTGVVVSSTQVKLSWVDNSTNETGFKIERKTGTNTYTVVGTTGENIMNYDNSGLSSSTTYTYRVYSYNATGNSITYSNEFVISTSGVPIITTTPITVNYQYAFSGGNITSDGSSPITSKGVVWDTSSNPTIALTTKTNDGPGSANFISTITTTLNIGTTYYVRAYATNTVGTSYGNELIYKPLARLPTVTFNGSSEPINQNITSSTATATATVSSDGGSPITARGFCWSTTSEPTVALSTKTIETGTIGNFSSLITNLLGNTTYYVGAYATNNAGTKYIYYKFKTLNATLPTVLTINSSNISAYQATINANVTSDGGSPITARGIVYGYGTATAGQLGAGYPFTTENGTIGTFSNNLQNLTGAITYSAKAYATNSIGTTYGNTITFNTPNGTYIGTSRGGGVVAYVLKSGDPGYDPNVLHGLIMAPTDQASSAVWCPYLEPYASNLIGTSNAFGTGASNTNSIVSRYGSGNYAARICYDLVLGGYSDWYLPSKEEFSLIYPNRVGIGSGYSDINNNPNYNYWTSSEYSDVQACYSTVVNPGYVPIFKNNGDKTTSRVKVRAIRSF